MIKKLFLIILLFFSSFLHSQDRRFEIEIGSPISEFIPRFQVKISLYAPADSLVFDSGFFEQDNYKSFSLRDWYKRPGSYKLAVSVFNNYNSKLLNKHCLEFELNGNELSVFAGIEFGDNDGKKAKHLSYIGVRRYYASTDSVVLKEKGTPGSDGYFGYTVQNNSSRTIYGYCLNGWLIGNLHKQQGGGWQLMPRYGIHDGRIQFDAPLNPGNVWYTDVSDFTDRPKKLLKGIYKYTTEYTYKKVFSGQAEPDAHGVNKNVFDYYILEKEFEITEE